MSTNGYQAANDQDDIFGDNAQEDDDLFGDDAPEPDDIFGGNAPAESEDSIFLKVTELQNTDDMGLPSFGDDVQLTDAMLDEIGTRELDIGEKADGAVDYEDISDNDLASDDEEPTGDGSIPQLPKMLEGIEDVAMGDGGDGDLDDLFGGPSSPVEAQRDGQDQFLAQHDQNEDTKDHGHEDADSDLASEHNSRPTSPSQLLQAEIDDIEDAQYRTQLALFAQSGKGFAPATEAENVEELVKLEFPDFKRDEMPYFNRLFPPKQIRWVGKTPLKPPKPIRPTKVILELDQDQKALFNSAVPPLKRSWEEDENVVVIDGPTQAQDEEESEEESDLDEHLPGGLTMQDLDIICADFDTLSAIAESDTEAHNMASQLNDDDDISMFGFDDFNDFDHPVKKRRTGMDAKEIVSIYHLPMPSFDDPERLTRKLAQKVTLDLNDPQLLVEHVDPDTTKARMRPGEVKGVRTVKEMLKTRFNISNDADYDLLKQNHQHKIRGQLGALTIDHSTPALRLQYPYYKVKLPINETRNFHRRKIEFRHLGFIFSRPNKIKRKTQKGKNTKEIYGTTKDLSLADNSTSLLLEYSEEHPLMMSQAGMGSKVVNYYRRKAADDTSRPKGEIGETQVLLPEDKSPFSIFGHIEPGESITALYNSMCRAPIFKQNPQHKDFLVIREHTGMQGSSYYLRNIDQVYTVGQELPSVTVPGPHSRVVTTAAKNRLKSISFRIARRRKNHRLRVEDVTRHFPDTTDMQNRQKMKEFMVFSKEHKEWEMKPGEAVPDETFIQTLIKPEDVCLLESMQVGQQYLQDSGYGQEEEDDDDDGKDGENQSIEQELAPWKTTKNFINATQGKAMLTLYGDGDPSGRGEAFSFIKTSMKGGFKAKGAPINDMISESDKKALGGHSYNVARQQREYENSIRAIWEKQKDVLSSDAQHSEDAEMEDGVDDQEEFGSFNSRGRSVTATPVPSRRRDDESMTSFSKRSANSQSQRFLLIKRRVRLRNGDVETEEVMETNPAVIKQYLRVKSKQEDQEMDLKSAVPTGNAEYDARAKKRLAEELARLEKNRERRHQREKAKGITGASPAAGVTSPDAGGSETPTPATSGRQVQATQRKCANCGQVGHIKTNKKCAKCDLPFDEKVKFGLMMAMPMGGFGS